MNYQFIANTALFQGVSAQEAKDMLRCLSAVTKFYKKEQPVYRAGGNISAMGLVLSGSVNIVKHDVWGNRSILVHAGPGQVFGETYACLRDEPIMVDVVAAEGTEILFLDVNRVMETCSASCSFHNRLIRNLVYTLASRNQTLTSKMDHITPRSIRERLLSYLSSQAMRKGSYSFTIPFNRQQLAEYLSVDRSALSNELSKLQKEGLLTYQKNYFTLQL